ncbi:MAG: phospholipid carrier-dependent glycosyltransferase [Candidatus Andersenbacteria bacterium]|nr:phospholipid carrier-dependent glycosyltransferase [Candidatus Andersenbacteria bacterium]MBI3250230.1 phospholipid carrier-dependent glycosyltransferase [Candidatus Andersenbacteria bacterium]
MSRKLIFFAFAALALFLRLPGLGQFMTVDEQLWMLRSGEYWDKLLQGDFKGTFVTTHPGATITWLSGAGIVIQEQRLQTGIDTSNIAAFRMYALLPIVLVSALLIGAAAVYLTRLFSSVGGILAALLVAIDPYLVGMNQITHADALLGLFMLNAALSFLVAIRARSSLLPAGIFTGLALATKTLPSLWLFIFFGVVLLAEYVPQLRLNWQKLIRKSMYVFGVSMFTFVLVWPALWAKSDNLDQYIEQDTTSVATDEHLTAEEGESISGKTFYARTILGRSTPFTLVVALAVIFHGVLQVVRQKKMNVSLWLFFYALGYLLVITFVAKKGDRYALPALIIIPLLAGYGLALFYTYVIHSRFRFLARPAVFAVIIALSIQPLLLAPHAIAYNNPVFPNIRPLTQQGWGEGLEAAAAWINEQPFDERLHIASWYPSVISPFFEGRTMSLSSRDDHRVGYVVTYRNMLGRAGDTIASDVLDEFRNQVPAHTVYIQGMPYVWVYTVLGPYYFRQNVGELVTGVEVAQTVPISFTNWKQIDFGLATFGRQNTAPLTLHIREEKNGPDIRTVTISTENIPDQGWQPFEFAEIPNSAGKTYYVALTSEIGRPGNAVTVRYSSEDFMAGVAVFGGREREGDLAYRLQP